ncbi:hypothetical protein Dsin_022818 [Dipteronia sinensis]|uniref:Uncharacterized protein n=1 Tax=Dipteronia sinensis TaxID=43782 RepID=A0AAE0E060_9ROSI|nr:hypothetical protein Dsin_022818 [Dipteronia sinensis]
MCWEYLHPHLLFEIANGIGTPLHLDKATRDRTYGYYTRILVDLDLSIDLPKSIMVERETYGFLWTHTTKIFLTFVVIVVSLDTIGRLNPIIQLGVERDQKF